MSADLGRLVRDVVEANPAPATFEELDERTRQHVETMARMHGLTVEEVVAGLARAEDYASDDEADGIARRSRR